MEPAFLGLVLDSSVLIAAERKKLTPFEAISRARDVVGNLPIAISALSIAELAHGIHRADTPALGRVRRRFLNEKKFHVPVHPITESTA